eukprot:4154712-Prymnesium_polylepis.1
MVLCPSTPLGAASCRPEPCAPWCGPFAEAPRYRLRLSWHQDLHRAHQSHGFFCRPQRKDLKMSFAAACLAAAPAGRSGARRAHHSHRMRAGNYC